MRATLSGYYRNLQFDQSNTASKLFDVTKQISSGQKIQYAYEDTSVFVDTVRLDNEVTTLTQAEQNAQKALQFSTNTDTTMNEMTKILDAMKTDLIYAANGVHSPESLNAIALELRGLEENLTQLANTSIDGKYLFSGSAISTKPINANGDYLGNDADIFAHLGSGLEQKYNVSGSDLFLGAENGTHREVTTNISLKDSTTGEYASVDTTLENITGSTADQFFYIRGTNSDGSSFKNKISNVTSSTDINSLLSSIKASFTTSVDVSLDDRGAIVVTDTSNGSSKIDFHIVASELDVTSIETLTPATVSIEFIKSGYTTNALGTSAESAIYDRTFFTKDSTSLQSDVSQIVKSGRLDTNGNDISNSFATDSTKLHEVFSGVTYDALGNYAGGLDAKVINLEGVDINNNPYTASINLLDAGSTFTLNGSTYTIFDANTPPAITNAGNMTYRQLMDVVNIAVSATPPAAAPGSAVQYNAALNAANLKSETSLSHDGKIIFQEVSSATTNTQATLSMYDSNSDDFTQASSIATFNTNNALTISDPKTNFFQQIDDLIKSVELGRINADGNSGDPRNVGVENAIQVIDDLLGHLGNQHAVAGTQSQTLTRTVERTQLLLLTTQTLRSETLDVDIAEASLELKQLELNYQAMLSSVSRISQLSLVNYL